MDATDITTAIALVLVIEGMFPFLSPTIWRDTFERLVSMSNGKIRFFGLSSMLVGLVVLLFLS
ncbi:MAG: DUF2065 domain-containing protein [Proteobacteria bacterium]|nr:DUF2065 domain-containing protein [Pseudomonadota bacterium]MDA1331891.1 DUF2065 domain-containing protein [Pseudomonadota bacterium]